MDISEFFTSLVAFKLLETLKELLPIEFLQVFVMINFTQEYTHGSKNI